MNKKQKVLLSLAMTTILLTLIVVLYFAFENSAKQMVQTAKLTKEELYLSGNSSVETTAIIGAHDSKVYKQNGSFYYEASPSNLNKLYTPSMYDASIGRNIPLYCIQKGSGIISNKETVSAIRALNGRTGSGSSVPSRRYSNTYYVCTDNHQELIASGAYTVTAPNYFLAPYDGTYKYNGGVTHFAKGENISNEVRQIALWLNKDVNVGETIEASGAKFTYLNMAEELYKESKDYEDYEEVLKVHSDRPIKETTNKEVRVKVNYNEQYLIVGPYKIDYIEGKSGSATFSGISNMVVKGYNDKYKNKLIKDIDIVSYIQNGVEKYFDFFNPQGTDGYVDRSNQSYPVSGQEFYIKIKNPNKNIYNSNRAVRYITINVEYSYMTTYAIECKLEPHQLVAKPVVDSHTHDDDGDCEIDYHWKVSQNPIQNQFLIDAWGERNLYQKHIELTAKNNYNPPDDDDNPPNNSPVKITMSLGGYAWEDVKAGKETVSDGLNSKLYGAEENLDKAIPNVKVTLYECKADKNGNIEYKDGKPVGEIADLLSDEDRRKLSASELKRRVNPTLTDENGYYQFDGLNSLNKYYVTFEYHGQIYMPTEYLVTDKKDGEFIHQDSVQDMVINAKLYNSKIWKAASKTAEIDNIRENYNNKFAEIGSSPKNYQSSNSLESGALVQEGNNYYNKAYSIYNLMGYTLDENGNYKQTGIQLIDEFFDIDKNGNIVETTTINEGLISQKIKNYINKYLAYPNIKDIYQEIVDEAKSKEEKEELWRKLQYIEDCKITATTASPFKNKIDLYPVYDKFVIDDKKMVIPGVGTAPSIYDGQYYVNSGMWRREKANLSLRKDIFYAGTRVNGKTEVYQYDKRPEGENYWEIQVRMRDYNTYYGTSYNREIYPADYNYRAAATNLFGSDLELYVTYKITVRNASQGMVTEIPEVVDYYDKDYTYMPGLSWVMYKSQGTTANNEVLVSKKSYTNLIDTLNLNAIKNARNVDSSYGTNQNNSGTYTGQSIYGNVTHQDIEEDMNSVYVHGLEGKKLSTGESAYIYLTFKVNSDARGPVILDGDDSLKENYAEINGYKTFYAANKELPNNVIMSKDADKDEKNYDAAGAIDYNSTPGNLKLDDLKGNKHEKNFEDDTDRAKSIKVTVDNNAIRNVNGIVWEDERNKTIANAVIGDGVRKQNETGINGVTVELVEKLTDNQGNPVEYVWQTTKTKYNEQTKQNGYYSFENFIPGNYIVRFIYGDTTSTALTTAMGGENAVSYNGQDFKSTVYSQNLENNQNLADYTNAYYDIAKADSFSVNVSDAKDLWENRTANVARNNGTIANYKQETYQGRTTVNNYSATNVSNHIAEVLASPYAASKNDSLINELIQKTNMVAETGIMRLETEYNRTESDGDKNQSNGNNYLNGNDKNGSYAVNNVDFGLTERPKAQLELNKKVSSVKVVLANGNVLADAVKSADNLSWTNSKAYNLNNYIKGGKYDDYYAQSQKDNKYNRYSYRNEITKYINNLYNNGSSNGLIQVIMDNELMHGATIQVGYTLTVKNVGEIDYIGKDFYYKGLGATQKVTTNANSVIDYVSNNLQYKEAQNTGWKVVKPQDITGTYVNDSLQGNVAKFNTIIQTSSLDKNLLPEEEISTKLMLSQSISPQNSEDDLTYHNIAEIVQTSNTVGRRMAYSVVGNQDPTSSTPNEVDSSKAESVNIMPPFGQSFIYYGLGAIIGIIILAGVIIIKKKVLKK